MSRGRSLHRIPPALLAEWAAAETPTPPKPIPADALKNPWIRKALAQGGTLKQHADELAEIQERSSTMTILSTATSAEYYAALSYSQRAALARRDPKAFAAARAAHQARREQLAAALAKAPTLAARASIIEELTKL